MYAVSDASYGVGPCEARRLSKKSWKHDHRKSVNQNINEPRKYNKDQRHLNNMKKGLNVKNRLLQDAEDPNARLWKRTTKIEDRLNK